MTCLQKWFSQLGSLSLFHIYCRLHWTQYLFLLVVGHFVLTKIEPFQRNSFRKFEVLGDVNFLIFGTVKLLHFLLFEITPFSLSET